MAVAWRPSATPVQMSRIHEASFVHFACPVTPWSISLAQAARTQQIPVSVEINGRHLPHLTEHTAYPFLNSSELHSLIGLSPEHVPDFAALRDTLGCSEQCSIIVTDEDRHVWVYSATTPALQFPIKPVRPVVNRNAAGDYFNGGFLWQRYATMTSRLTCAQVLAPPGTV